MSRRLTVSAVCLALMCAAGAGATIGSADSGPGVCLKHPLRVMVGHGRSPRGQEWYIAAHLRNNWKCHARLLDFSFYPFGHSGIWRGAGYGVPIGGSLSSTFVVISSHQDRSDGEIAYSGITSGKVALVEASTRNGGWVKIEPERPQIANPPAWLRNVRYFMKFLPGNEKVERIRVRDRAGRVLYQGRESVFGDFDGEEALP